jgi:D-tagatose-1,6-bisphosphate aldolase subunit GatZ/KbaZ
MNRFASRQDLLDIIADQKAGRPRGIYSVCTANSYAIEASVRQAAQNDLPLLVEATCNQVNQYGGYTGMTPRDFARFVASITEEMSASPNRIILGGDHLGPNPWQDEPARSAMAKARQLVTDFVEAGFVKVHLDASMWCADDDRTRPLDPGLSAERAADLCEVAEQAHRESGSEMAPVFVIGTEVPAPGGARQPEEGIRVTDAADAQEALRLFGEVFHRRGLDDAWTRVVALVVQPGVDFDHARVFEYDRESAQALSLMIESVPGVVFEAHSTDYQPPDLLRQMVEDHFAILKVGPMLTFAFREAVFALARMEEEWLGGRRDVVLSSLIEVVDQSMLQDPQYWARYYSGTDTEQALARKYGLSDRIRYYWPKPAVAQALRRLVANLEQLPLPLSLISQYLPTQYRHIREGLIRNQPNQMIWDHIQEAGQYYVQACLPG